MLKDVVSSFVLMSYVDDSLLNIAYIIYYRGRGLKLVEFLLFLVGRFYFLFLQKNQKRYGDVNCQESLKAIEGNSRQTGCRQ